jgi:hypothetical protein
MKKDGKANKKSMKRPIVESTLPRKNPIMIPATTPIAIESIVVINATKKEIRAPKINLANKSCPIPGSIPSG